MTSLIKENLNTEEKTEEKTESIDYQSISQVRDIFIKELMLLDKSKGTTRILEAIRDKCLVKNNAIEKIFNK